MKKFVTCFYSVFCGFLFAASVAYAQDITVATPNGGLEISGELLSYDNDTYVIKTPNGPITVLAKGLICDGENCPIDSVASHDLTFVGSGPFVENILADYFYAYAQKSGAANINSSSQAFATKLNIANKDNTELANITISKSQAAPSGAVILGQTPRNPYRYNVSTLASDALVPIVNSSNSVSSITLTQLNAILSGDITNWKQLGGTDSEIALYLTSDVLNSDADWPKALVKLHTNLNRYSPLPIQTAQNLEKMVDAFNPALGLIRYSERKNGNILALKDSCKNVYDLSPYAIKTGQYPTVFQYHMFRPKTRYALWLNKAINALNSELANNVIDTHGPVTARLLTEPSSQTVSRLNHAIAALPRDKSSTEIKRFNALSQTARRLSFTFRFDDSGQALNPASQMQARALVQAIEQQKLSTDNLIFVGFTDTLGDEKANLALARKRTDAALLNVFKNTKITKPQQQKISKDWFGETAPITCNNTSTEHLVNRRVEVWQRKP